MHEIKTSIIPTKQTLVTLKEQPKGLDLKAICAYVATGFFLEEDTFWKHKKVLAPGCINQIDIEGNLINSKPWFTWSHQPDNTHTFKSALDAFSDLFETVINEQVGDNKVILPLSGGIDSRTQAVALKRLNKEVTTYSYAFKGGYPEHKIGREIARQCDFDFGDYLIKPNYLWSSINRLAKINHCYSEFTHPRQMALIDHFENMGDIFSLGHWGDVLFDDMKVPDNLPFVEQIDSLYKKIVKPSGKELAEKLWRHFDLAGDFKDYLYERFKVMHKKIAIENSANARIRAFKSRYWAPRWTSINLSIFSEIKPITLPYYDDKICQFVCNMPEKYLANRALQIEYIKTRNPQLAKIMWHQQTPFNLINYKFNRAPYNLPYRIFSKSKRVYKEMIGSPLIQRNWELQFLGDANQTTLLGHLYKNSLIPKDLIKEVYDNFMNKDKVAYAHAVSMILTLSLWDELYNNK